MVYEIFTSFLIFKMVWWIVFFCILPIKSDAPSNPEKGFASSAPQKTYLKKKLLITTLISTVIWLIIELIFKYELITIEIPDIMEQTK